jgi:hypothetical protein
LPQEAASAVAVAEEFAAAEQARSGLAVLALDDHSALAAAGSQVK